MQCAVLVTAIPSICPSVCHTLVSYPAEVAKSSTYQLQLGKGRKVTVAGWQETLCDPIWHVISRSGVEISIMNCYIRVYFIFTLSTIVGGDLPFHLTLT